MDSSPAVDRWSCALGACTIPVLQASAQAIAHWAEHSDRVDAHRLGEIAQADPLLGLRVLIHASRRFSARLAKPVDSVTAALVLMGVEPFFREFGALPVLQDVLAAQPAALAGALRAIERAHAAARLAAAFAIHRQDPDVELLHQAALLHDVAGLLLWCADPVRALQIVERQQREPQLRTAAAQSQVLGTELAPVAARLMEGWGLPATLRELHGGTPGPALGRMGARTVQLAVRIARHVDKGWDDTALPDDFVDLGVLLNLPAPAAAALVRGTIG